MLRLYGASTAGASVGLTTENPNSQFGRAMTVLRKRDPLSLYSKTVLKLAYAHITFYIVGIFTVKFAFLSLYLSLTEHMTTTVRRVAYATGLFCGLCGALNLFIQSFWCEPIDRNWVVPFSDPNKTFCSPPFELTPAAVQTATNMVSDLMILGLGIFIISKLQMNKRQTIAFAFIVCIGIIPLTVTSLRFAKIYRITVTHDITNDNSDIIVVYTLTDWVFAMVAACLPALRGYLRRGRLARTKTSKTSSGGIFTTISRKKFRNSLLDIERGHVTLSSETENTGDGAELLVLRSTHESRMHSVSEQI